MASIARIRPAALAIALMAVLLGLHPPAEGLDDRTQIPMPIPSTQGASSKEPSALVSGVSSPLGLSEDVLGECGLSCRDWQTLGLSRDQWLRVEEWISGRARSVTYGQSVESMVGVFSIEKKVVLGDNPTGEAAGDAGSGSIGLASGVDLARKGPKLLYFDFYPRIVNSTAEPRDVNFTLQTDGLLMAPVASSPGDTDRGNLSRARFVSPSGGRSAEVVFQSSGNSTGYEGNMTLPQDSEAGLWRLNSLTLVGASGFRVQMDADEVQAAGYPTAIRVE